MTTALQTFKKNVRGPQLYPFAIGFVTVFIGSALLFRVKDEDYLNSQNPRFAASFVKNGAGDAHGHGH